MTDKKRAYCSECIVRNCDKTFKIVTRCIYCQSYFCDAHYEPRLAFMRSFIEHVTNKELQMEYEKELRRSGGHPDWDWNLTYFERMKERNKKYSDAFDKLLNSSYIKNKQTAETNSRSDSPPKQKGVLDTMWYWFSRPATQEETNSHNKMIELFSQNDPHWRTAHRENKVDRRFKLPFGPIGFIILLILSYVGIFVLLYVLILLKVF